MTTSPERKKVLILITKSNFGGAQRYVFDLATHLPRDRYEVIVALGGNGMLAEELRENGVRTVPLQNLERDISFVKEVRAFKEINTLLRDESPDILHVNSSKAGGIGAFVGRVRSVPRIIYTAHGWAFNEDRPWWQRVLIKALHWLTIMLAHATITVSRGMQREMAWPLVQKKMTPINPGRVVQTICNKTDARNAIVKNAPGLREFTGDLWLGTVAELHPIKRLHNAIDAVASLVKEHPRLRYVIVGAGELREELTQYTEKLGLQEHVFFTGMIPDAARYISAFDVFVLPSHSESYGYVLLEAGHANVAVVATAVGGVLDIITDTETGLLVPPDDVPALRTALRKLTVNTDERARLSDALHASVLERTPDQMVHETLRVYETK